MSTALFQSASLGEPDLFVDITTEEDEAPVLAISITAADGSGRQVVEIFTDNDAEIRQFFAAVDRAKKQLGRD